MSRTVFEGAVVVLLLSSANWPQISAGGKSSAVTTASEGVQNACHLNGDGVVDSTDVQLALSMDVGLVPCTANLLALGVCNIVVVQRVVNAALGRACQTTAHSVSLTCIGSSSASVIGYNVYRSSISGGSYSKVNSSLVTATSYSDINVQAGQIYFYVTTAVDNDTNESAYSNEARAAVPWP